MVKLEEKDLIRDLEIIIDRVKPLLARIIETFPDYTDHDITHSTRVLRNLDLVIPAPLEAELNAYEKYFLIASAYLHDIGMVNFPEFIKGTSLENTDNHAIREYIRENHHLRSETFIVNNFRDLGIENIHQARIIGRICRGHRRENLHDRELYKSDMVYSQSSINVPLLAAFLRIGDELDLTFERTPWVIYEHVIPRDNISSNEWEKHLSASGIAFHPEDPLIICCFATCKNPKIHRSLRNLETKINRELDDLPRHLHQYRERAKDLPRKFIMEIEAEDYKPYDFRFSLHEKEIAKLLMGEKLYKRKEESLRELLKNSVDTCRMRKEILGKHGLGYEPKITFELKFDPKRIIVSDNGMGMDEYAIERYFTKIGESFYTTPEFLEENFSFTPVSELGIGFLSCFMIADRIVVETKADHSDPLILEIDDVSDYFFVRKGSREDTGTSITLFLKNDIIVKGNKMVVANPDYIDLEKEIRYYARHLEFPVSVKVGPEPMKEHIIQEVEHESDLSQALGYYSKNFNFYPIEINEEKIKGFIRILLRKDEELGLIPSKGVTTHRDIQDLILSHCGATFFISNEGILVCHTNIIPSWLDNQILYVDLDLQKNVLDLNVARNDIVQGTKLDSLKSNFERILIERLSKYLSTLEEKVKKANRFFPEFSRIFLSTYIDLYAIDKSKSDTPFIDFLKRFYFFKCVSKEGIKYLRCNEIVDGGKPVYILGGFNEYDDTHKAEIIQQLTILLKSDNLYLAMNYPTKLSELLLDKVTYIDFFQIISAERSYELRGLIPKSWTLAKLNNYKTSRFIEFSHGYGEITVVNRDNRFVDLLIRNKDLIYGDRKIALLGFFRSLKQAIRTNFHGVRSQHSEILKWFVDAQVIAEDQIEDYLFVEDDFPPHMLHW